jgi:glyoxylase I family protein
MGQAERPELEARVEALGASVESRSEHSSYLRDPEGNRVALSHYPLPTPSPRS